MLSAYSTDYHNLQKYKEEQLQYTGFKSDNCIKRTDTFFSFDIPNYFLNKLSNHNIYNDNLPFISSTNTNLPYSLTNDYNTLNNYNVHQIDKNNLQPNSHYYWSTNNNKVYDESSSINENNTYVEMNNNADFFTDTFGLSETTSKLIPFSDSQFLNCKDNYVDANKVPTVFADFWNSQIANATSYSNFHNQTNVPLNVDKNNYIFYKKFLKPDYLHYSLNNQNFNSILNYHSTSSWQTNSSLNNENFSTNSKFNNKLEFYSNASEKSTKTKKTKNSKIFPCTMCSKQYYRKGALKTHMKYHIGERPFVCQTCGKSFSQAANLTAHKRVHTGEKPFKCVVCFRLFTQSSSLVTHKRTHTGERPYPCNHCNKAFTDSSTLTKHLRTHTGQKPYSCNFCFMQFSQSGNLHRHMKTHNTTIAL